MRLAPVLILLLAIPLLAEEGEEKKPPPDPVELLPGCLRPGAKATYERSTVGKTLPGEIVYRAEKGEAKHEVRLVREFSTRGRIVVRTRLTAILVKLTRALVSFTLEASEEKSGALELRARLRPDPKRKGDLVYERFEGGKRKKKAILKKPTHRWVPEDLEPFLAGLGDLSAEEPEGVLVMRETEGRWQKQRAHHSLLGKGEKKVGKAEIPCRIVERRQGKERVTWYLRDSDLMPVEAAGLEIHPEEDGRK